VVVDGFSNDKSGFVFVVFVVVFVVVFEVVFEDVVVVVVVVFVVSGFGGIVTLSGSTRSKNNTDGCNLPRTHFSFTDSQSSPT